MKKKLIKSIYFPHINNNNNKNHNNNNNNNIFFNLIREKTQGLHLEGLTVNFNAINKKLWERRVVLVTVTSKQSIKKFSFPSTLWEGIKKLWEGGLVNDYCEFKKISKKFFFPLCRGLNVKWLLWLSKQSIKMELPAYVGWENWTAYSRTSLRYYGKD